MKNNNTTELPVPEIPSFLISTFVPSQRYGTIEKLISNWNVLSDSLKTMNELEVLEALYVELMTKRRLQIVQRLKSRFNVLRNRRENYELTNLPAERENS